MKEVYILIRQKSNKIGYFNGFDWKGFDPVIFDTEEMAKSQLESVETDLSYIYQINKVYIKN